MMNKIIGAIDCGTNSTRLLIIDDDKNQIYRDSRVTRLGQNVDKEKNLDEDAVSRTLKVLKDYFEIGQSFNVTEWGLIATSAVRDSKNSQYFIKAVRDLFGVTPMLLSGYKEAVLSFKGAMSGLESTKERVVVIDIGGGSTEVISGLQLDYLNSNYEAGKFVSNALGGSIDIGCVRLTERFFKSDPVDRNDLEKAFKYVSNLFTVVCSRYQNLQIERVYAVAGTAISLYMVANGIKEYSKQGVHLKELTLDQIEATLQYLAELPLSKRRELSGLEVGRAEVIVAGALILLVALQKFGIKSCHVLESDILDGLALKILRQIDF